MFLFVSFPIFSGILLVLWLFSLLTRKFRQFKLVSRLLVGQLLTYLVSVVAVFYDPYWLDDGVRTLIEFPRHFIWAIFYAGVFQFIVTPLTVGIIYLYKRLV